jgi:hypothetical protein
MTTQQALGAHDLAPLQETVMDPWRTSTPCWHEPGGPVAPRRPTQARLRTYFLRHFSRSGSQAEAAARTGITPRTVQRWCATDPRFAFRYEAVRERRAEMLEDAAMHRALSMDRRSVFHRGKPVAIVERYNDAMLMRLLTRFDRIRERMPPRAMAQREVDLDTLSDFELAQMAGYPLSPDLPEDEAVEDAFRRIVAEVEKRLVSRVSPSERQASEVDAGR